MGTEARNEGGTLRAGTGRLEVGACTNIMMPLGDFLQERLSNLIAGPLKTISGSTAHSGTATVNPVYGGKIWGTPLDRGFCS